MAAFDAIDPTEHASGAIVRLRSLLRFHVNQALAFSGALIELEAKTGPRGAGSIVDHIARDNLHAAIADSSAMVAVLKTAIEAEAIASDIIG